MQTLFKSNLFSSSSSKMGAKSFLSGGKKLGSSIVGAAKNNIVNFARTAKAMIPQKKEEKENNFIKNYTNFFGSKKTEKILRKNLKLVRDSLVNTFEIAKLLKASIVSITKDLKGGIGKGGGIFGSLLGLVSIAGLLTNPFVLSVLGLLAAGGVIALLSNEKIRDAVFGFLEKYAKPVVGFLWNSISKLIGGLIKEIVPKWIYNPAGFIRDLITGGDEFSKKHSELDQRLKDAGMNTIGLSDDRTKQEIRTSKHGRTEEQEKIFQEVEAERSKLKETKKTMRKDMNAAEKKVVADRKPVEKQLEKEIKSLPFGSKERVAKEKEWRLYTAETGKLRKEAREEVKLDANKSVSSQQDVNQVESPKDSTSKVKEEIKSDANQNISSPPTTENNVDAAPFNVDAVKSNLSDSSFTTSYKMAESGSIINLQGVPMTMGDATNRSSSGGDVTSTSNGGGTSGGDAVTFYSSSNPDSSYHKLNALMTFNIV